MLILLATGAHALTQESTILNRGISAGLSTQFQATCSSGEVTGGGYTINDVQPSGLKLNVHTSVPFLSDGWLVIVHNPHDVDVRVQVATVVICTDGS